MADTGCHGWIRGSALNVGRQHVGEVALMVTPTGGRLDGALTALRLWA